MRLARGEAILRNPRVNPTLCDDELAQFDSIEGIPDFFFIARIGKKVVAHGVGEDRRGMKAQLRQCLARRAPALR